MKSELTPNDHSHKDISDPKVSSGFGAQTSVLGRRSSNLGSDGLTGVIIRGNSYRADLLEVDLNPAIGGLERYAMASRNPNRKTSYAGISSSHLKVSLLQDELATPMKQVIQHRGFSDPEKLAQISLTKALDSKKNNNIFFADQNFARAMSNAPNGMLEGPGMVDRMINYGATVTRDESWSDYEQYLKESYGAGNGTDMSRGSNLAPGQTPKYFFLQIKLGSKLYPWIWLVVSGSVLWNILIVRVGYRRSMRMMTTWPGSCRRFMKEGNRERSGLRVKRRLMRWAMIVRSSRMIAK